MRISDALALLALAGCAVTEFIDRRQVALTSAGARTVVVAPAEFCIDPPMTGIAPQVGVVTFIECGTLYADLPEPEQPPVVFQVRISNSAWSASLEDLAANLRNEQVRAVLGGGTPTRILAERIENDVLFLKVESPEMDDAPDMAPTYWQAFFAAGERLAIASIQGLGAARPSDRRSRALLAEVAELMRAANAAPPAD